MNKRLFKIIAVVLFSLLAITFSVNFAFSAERETLFIKPGGSQILTIENISKNIKIFVSEQDIVHARMLKENKVYIRGKAPGYCTVTIWDNIGKQVTSEIDVTVSYDLSGLKKQIANLLPNQDIKVHGADDGIVLSGTVTGPEIVEQAIRLAEAYLPTESSVSMVAGGAGGTTTSKKSNNNNGGSDGEDSDVSQTGRTKTKIGKVTNFLTIGAIHQVMLEVKIAEVSRDSGMDWGAGLSYFGLGDDFGGIVSGTQGAGGAGFFPSNAKGTNLGSIVTNFVGSAANIFLNIDNVNLALDFLESEGLSNILAEPKLVSLSGQEASFLAGGRFPFVSGREINNDTTIETVSFEEFGVSLKFTPIVKSNGLITLRVAPRVSEIVDTIDTGTGNALPLVDTRQLETTAQLRDGQTLVLAGLLSETTRNNVDKIPMLGDIPVLGALFRSNAYTTDKSDLMITITPHLVSPTREDLISYPGEFIKEPSRLEFYLLGKLEGMRRPNDKSRMSYHNFAAPSGGGLEGSFGHSN